MLLVPTRSVSKSSLCCAKNSSFAATPLGTIGGRSVWKSALVARSETRPVTTQPTFLTNCFVTLLLQLPRSRTLFGECHCLGNSVSLQAKQSFADKCVPKQSLGTRRWFARNRLRLKLLVAQRR